MIDWTTSDENHAKEVVAHFLADAKREWAHQADWALRRISKLPWWWAWRGPQIADEALGTGPYWSKGFKGKQDISPKNLLDYYWRTFLYWLGFRKRGRDV